VSWRWPNSLEAKNDSGDLIAVKMPVEQIERIKGLGYTESEARFLYVVAVHSGYFTLRQFCTFTHAARGKRSFLFARKLLHSGHASMRDYPGVGLVFHLFSRTVYGQMEKDNLRNRRRHSFEFIRTRLLLLDFILANQILVYFETEQDKVRFFCETMGMSRDCLPAKVYEGRQGSQPRFVISLTNFPSFLLRLSQGLLLWSRSAMWMRDSKHGVVSSLIWPRTKGSSGNWQLSAFCTLLQRTPISRWRNRVFVHS
jgi:hypothetical protein